MAVRQRSTAVALPGRPICLGRCDTPGVPTDIYFAAASLRIRVEEDPDQVAEAWTSAQGVPFRLTAHGAPGEVYVNPGLVAFWQAADRSPEPGPAQESPQPANDPGAVDIWGRPLRRRPRG